MFYKFVGGDDLALLDIFDRAAAAGSLKFSSALTFNDPFEFKFRSVPPESREAFDAWHRTYAPERSPEELDRAWTSFSGEGARWNTVLRPRIGLLEHMYVLCLAQRWDSHLMWGHYGVSHRGFVIIYRSEIVDALARLADVVEGRPVDYRDETPELRWFDGPPEGPPPLC